MTKLAVALLLTWGLALTPALVLAQKLAIVDGADIIFNSAEGKRVQENIKKKYEELGKPLQQKQQTLAKELADAEKQAAVMKEDARKRKEQEFTKKVEDLRKQEMDAQKQIAQYEEKEKAPLFQKLERAVKEVAQENKVEVILDKRSSGVLYMDSKLDLTDKVRTKFGK
ncbi:MAG: OmpH family outer membrane protein [Deltaproteobacteria bacterium]|nr:OmpH family outer membrane protein [Deltaproteobacteria bacterium]